MKDVTSPFSYDQRDRFTFTKSEKNIVERLECLFKNGYGINIIYGDRGVGKTTLKNYAKHKVLEDNETIVIDIPRYMEDTEFYSYILENIILQVYEKRKRIIKNYKTSFFSLSLANRKSNCDKKIEIIWENIYIKFKIIKQELPPSSEWVSTELKKEIKKFSGELNSLEKEIDNLNKANSRKKSSNYYEKIQIDLERLEKILNLKTWYQYEKYLNELNSLQKIFDAIVTKDEKSEHYIFDELENKSKKDVTIQTKIIDSIFRANIFSSQTKSEVSKSKHSESNSIRSNLTFNQKKKRLIDILKDLQNVLDLKINICIDELDKCTTEEVNELINKNKDLFLESSITTFLLMSLEQGIIFKEKYSHYITSFILCKSLSIYEFVVKSANQGKEIYYDFFDLLNGYYSVRGNNRNLTIKDIRDKKHELIESIIYIYMCQSDFYQKLTEEYQELFAKFFDIIIMHLKLLGELEKNVFEALILEFKNCYGLELVKIDCLFEQLEMNLYCNTLQQKSFFYQLWEDSHSIISNKLENETYEGVHFYDAFENFFYDLAKNSLSIENTKLVLNPLSNSTIKEKIDDFFKSYSLTRDEFMELFKEFAGMKNNCYLRSSRGKKIRYFDSKSFNGIDDAKLTINKWRNEIIGVVFFYPKDREGKPLINCLIYRYNNFGEILCIPYVGYIGLHSHKPQRLKEYKEFLDEQNVLFVDIEELEEQLFDEAYKKSNESEEKIIKDICKKYDYLNLWLEKIPDDYS